ncbi:MAG: nucleotide exchange factor GrpE [Gaiellaceae bacterium]
MPSSPGTERDSAAADEREFEQALSREELRAELEGARAQVAASEERHLRARADLDNYRKRAERELERRVREQTDELLRDWLEVVDAAERALALEVDERAAGGLRAFLDQMEAILARQRVRRIGHVGDRFDPELHEAIAAIPDREHPPGTITEIARSGYGVDDRVLRPAQVAVARPADDSG